MTRGLTRSWLIRVASMAATAVAASMAQAAPPAEIAIPGERVFPESITSSSDGTLYIGSIEKKLIFRVKPGAATAEPWILPGTDGINMIFGVFADNKSRTLWACSNLLGPSVSPTAPAAPATLHAFDLETGAPKSHYLLPTPIGFCNDIAVGGDGTVYATDTNNMEIVSLKKGAHTLEVWAGNGAFGPNGGVLDGISVLGNRVLVNALVTNKLFSVPIEAGGKAGAVTEVKLDRPLDHPDGMRTFGKNSVLVIEGGSGGRLSKVVLDKDTGTSKSIREGYPDGPVAVTVVGTTAYVLEGQLALMFHPPGNTLPSTPNPFHATSVEVGRP